MHLVDEVLFNIDIVNKESLPEFWSFFLRKHLSAYLVTTCILGVSNFASLITVKPPWQWKIMMLGNRLNNGGVLVITNPVALVNKESLPEFWSFFLRKHLSAYLVMTYILGVSNFASLITVKPPRQWKIIMLGNRLSNGSGLVITNPVALLFSTCMGMRTGCFSQPLEYWMVLSMFSPVIVICK